MLRPDGGGSVKSPVASISVTRFVLGTPEQGYRPAVRRSQSVKTWAEATKLIFTWSADEETVENDPSTILVRPRWMNGLVTHEIGLDLEGARNVPSDPGLGEYLESWLRSEYGGAANSKRRSVKATLIREVLGRCSFSDETDAGDDARVFDAAKRALEQCFHEDAPRYVERIRGWMLDGGRVR